MAPRVRKLVLTAHVTFSVGWLGAVAAFLALAVAGLRGQNAAYLSMELIGWFVIVPCCLAALVTGLVQSLGTEWGLFRHYWILVKFLLTVGATILLLLHMQPVSRMSQAAATTLTPDLRPLQIQLVADAGLALVVLLAATILSIFKPWGLTAYGRRKKAMPSESSARFSWGLVVIVGMAVLLLGVVVLHLTGGGLHGH
jgi:hypothetical protein